MTALQIEYDGIVYMIKNASGQYWQGEQAEPGKWNGTIANGWMTDTRERAFYQLECLNRLWF